MSLPTYAASESNELKNVTLSLYSNLSPERYISGLYRDNTFYITLEDLCALTRGKIVKETEEEAVVSFGNCRNGKSIREFVIDVGSGNMAETLYSDKYNITLPSLTQDGKVYVSALHFLRYLGATVKLQEDSPVQFMVIKRYDIFDALSDLINSDLGNFFWWDEVDTGEEDLEDKLTNAGVIALIDRDSNIFRMMFDAKGIEQEALEDALLSIVKNEGQGYFTENSAESELIDTASSIIGAEADWFDLIKEAYADGSDVLGDQISDLASSAAITSGFVNNVIGAFESLKQFDNMSSSQRNLLEKTVLQYHEDSKTLCDGWNVVFDAAKNVSGKIQSEYDAQYKAALDVAESTAYDLLNGATGNPVSIAWSGATLLTKMIPFTNEMIDKKIQLYNSYNCSIIQLIAYEMLIEAYSDWYYGNALYTSSSEQYKKLDAVKQLIILQLKSTLTTREYLINSGFLESNYASEMKAMNQETAILLNKTENCQINGVDLFTAEYKDDISWLSNIKVDFSQFVDYSNLVTDAYAAEITGEYGDCLFSIPQINIAGGAIEAINKEIWDKLYVGVVEEIRANLSYAGGEYIKYEWVINGDILSLWIESHPVGWAWWDYYVYNVAISTGTPLSNEEVISSAGLTTEEYYEKAKQVLGSQYWSNWERDNDNFYDPNFVEWFNQSLRNTISDENIRISTPCFNSDGQLCIVAPVYSMAGADYYWHILNMEDFVLLPYYAEDAVLLTHSINISEDKAYEIACDYWNYSPGSVSEETGFELFLVYDGLTEKYDGNHYYSFRLQWWVPEEAGWGNHMSTIDYLYVNAETGECTDTI